jgi:glycosyltransferase involved in cell wall biosynthesis
MTHGFAQVTRGWDGPRPPVSVVILTLNEEDNIPGCLASCAWSDDVHVLDSGSKDRTVELSRSLGAGVHTNPFESFGAQRNWAIDNIPLRHDWVFHLDADERFTPELVRAMDRLVASGPAEAGFHVPSRLMFMGQWLRRAGGYPVYQMRLFHRARMRFCDHGHGQREQSEGQVGRLDEPYLHFAFSKGLHDWLDKHNRYSTLEARQMLAEGGEGASAGALLGAVFGGDRIARRRALKRLTSRTPCRATARRLYTLLVQGGLLDGRAGWTYARMLAVYEEMIALKLRVFEREGRGGGGSPDA